MWLEFIVFKIIDFPLIKCGELNDRMVHVWEHIGSQLRDYQLYSVDEEK